MYTKTSSALIDPFLNLWLYTRVQEVLAYYSLSREGQL